MPTKKAKPVNWKSTPNAHRHRKGHAYNLSDEAHARVETFAAETGFPESRVVEGVIEAQLGTRDGRAALKARMGKPPASVTNLVLEAVDVSGEMAAIVAYVCDKLPGTSAMTVRAAAIKMANRGELKRVGYGRYERA